MKEENESVVVVAIAMLMTWVALFALATLAWYVSDDHSDSMRLTLAVGAPILLVINGVGLILTSKTHS